VRLGNVYGPRQDPLGEAGVIAIFCGRVQREERPTVYGSGEQTRDYVFVGDVVGALLAALANPEATGEFNVGTGRESSVLDIVRELAAHVHADFDPELAPERASDSHGVARELAHESSLALLPPVGELGFADRQRVVLL
jgi:UDP-glucose 4-epimerase